MAATLQEILGIPGNQAVYDPMKQLLEEGSPIAFLGAGASAPLYPLWGELIKRLAHEPVLRGLATEADEQYWLGTASTKPLRVASQIHAKFGDALYHTVTESICYLGQNKWDLALTACERALQLASPRNYCLIHADALNLRARIKLERPEPDRTDARDDTEAALQLANYCDYHWARLDAQAILKSLDKT